jgi:hypothetical protein
VANTKILNASMDNVYASRLGQIAYAAGDPARTDVGDAIDRGLILLSMLNAAGFVVHADYSFPHRPVADIIAARQS